jgi:uncharacterized protein (TIGR03437 family)
MKGPMLLALAPILAFAGLPAYAQFVFGTPRNLGPPINTPGIENGPNLSTDGLTLYFVSDRPGGHSGMPELWMSTRNTTRGPWGPPVNLGPTVNSHFAASPSISADERELYFASTPDRPGDQGNGDIWLTRRERPSEAWITPENLGPVVNSAFADGTPKLSRDGLALFFESNRPGGSGGLDIWVTSRGSRSEPWEAPVNLGPVVNGPGRDRSPAISTNGLTLIFQSNRPGGLGADDFWVTTRASRSSPWGPPVHLGPGINTPDDEAKPDFSVDGRSLLFMSTRPGGVGLLDIWEVPILMHVEEVANAASSLAGPVAPGEIIFISGVGLGSEIPVAARFGENGLLPDWLAQTRVLFDGMPAPLIGVNQNRVTALAPYELKAKSSTELRIEYDSQVSIRMIIPIAEAAPGIFTIDASGSGQAAMLNLDGRINSASSPAARGSIVSLFATGEGQSDTPGVDGKPVALPFPKPVRPVSVDIGGINAEVFYAGGAPGLVGVLQVNARVPNTVNPGNAVAVVLRVGESDSPPGVTMAVR